MDWAESREITTNEEEKRGEDTVAGGAIACEATFAGAIVRAKGVGTIGILAAGVRSVCAFVLICKK